MSTFHLSVLVILKRLLKALDQSYDKLWKHKRLIKCKLCRVTIKSSEYTFSWNCYVFCIIKKNHRFSLSDYFDKNLTLYITVDITSNSIKLVCKTYQSWTYKQSGIKKGIAANLLKSQE